MAEAELFTYTEKVSPEVISLIESSVEYDGNTVKLTCGQLERSTYEQVDEVFSRFGGKWVSRRKSHVFPFDPKPLINEFLKLGLMPPKNPLAFFPTPRPVVDRLIGYLDRFKRYKRILEPSAGQGAIADVLREYLADDEPQIDVVEMDKYNRSVLQSKGYQLVGDDFLRYGESGYDLIVMNPPFAIEGDKRAWATHFMHACELLAEGGDLIAILPPFEHLDESRLDKFFEVLGRWRAEVELIDGKPFKESGTDISVNVVWVERPTQSELTRYQEMFNGYRNYWEFEFFCYSDHTRSLYERKQALYESIEKEEAGDDEIMAFITDARKGLRKDGVFLGLTNEEIPMVVNNIKRQALDYLDWKQGAELTVPEVLAQGSLF